MKNKGTFVRISCALSLILALGVAPGLSVYAQQGAQKLAPRAEVAADKSAKASENKPQQPSAEAEPLPLSDAEMEKVEGGWFMAAIAVAGLGLAAYNTFRHHPAPRTTVNVHCR